MEKKPISNIKKELTDLNGNDEYYLICDKTAIDENSPSDTAKTTIKTLLDYILSKAGKQIQEEKSQVFCSLTNNTVNNYTVNSYKEFTVDGNKIIIPKNKEGKIYNFYFSVNDTGTYYNNDSYKVYNWKFELGVVLKNVSDNSIVSYKKYNDLYTLEENVQGTYNYNFTLNKSASFYINPVDDSQYYEIYVNYESDGADDNINLLTFEVLEV